MEVRVERPATCLTDVAHVDADRITDPHLEGPWHDPLEPIRRCREDSGRARREGKRPDPARERS